MKLLIISIGVLLFKGCTCGCMPPPPETLICKSFNMYDYKTGTTVLVEFNSDTLLIAGEDHIEGTDTLRIVNCAYAD